jgi:hypothetical protein
MLSLRSSPWIRGAPHSALVGLMARISWRISSGTFGLPSRHRDSIARTNETQHDKGCAHQARSDARLRECRRRARLPHRGEQCLAEAQRPGGPQGGVTSMPRPSFDRAAIEAEFGRVRSCDLDELRTLWRVTFRSCPPPAFTKDRFRPRRDRRLGRRAHLLPHPFHGATPLSAGSEDHRAWTASILRASSSGVRIPFWKRMLAKAAIHRS